MKWDVKNQSGEVLSSVDLPEDIFGVQMNESVLHTVVKAYRANRRQGTHATKTRSMVSGGGKKPFKQKGTGSARQGSSRSPLMEGGATLHGPQPRDYTEHVNRKVKRLALKVALSDKVRNNSFSVISVDNLDKGTKAFVSCVNSLGSARTRLVGHVDAHGLSPVYLAARNVHGHAAVSVDELNAENVLRYEHLILTEKALEKLVSRLRSGRK